MLPGQCWDNLASRSNRKNALFTQITCDLTAKNNYFLHSRLTPNFDMPNLDPSTSLQYVCPVEKDRVWPDFFFLE
jgi:hypothetical protein